MKQCERKEMPCWLTAPPSVHHQRIDLIEEKQRRRRLARESERAPDRRLGVAHLPRGQRQGTKRGVARAVPNKTEESLCRVTRTMGLYTSAAARDTNVAPHEDATAFTSSV
jgi:hypothetical protein